MRSIVNAVDARTHWACSYFTRLSVPRPPCHAMLELLRDGVRAAASSIVCCTRVGGGGTIGAVRVRRGSWQPTVVTERTAEDENSVVSTRSWRREGSQTGGQQSGFTTLTIR